MTQYDEPLLDDWGVPKASADGDRGHMREKIGRLLNLERYGVLCTQGKEQPYGSLVAFAASEDLCSLVFSTPTSTRKYRLLTESPRVALVVDSRSRFPDDLTQIEGVTATGRAVHVSPGREFEPLAERLVSRHPHLKSFVYAPSAALIRIDVYRYFHVARFQEVTQWVPQRP